MLQAALFATLGFVAFAVVFYVLAGRWVARRVISGTGDRDRILSRAVRRAFLLFLAGSAVILLCTLLAVPRIPLSAWAVLVYLLPLLWAWVTVLGSSWMEMRALDLSAGLWRYHRFNLFSAFMLRGQRIPFFSAAVAAPTYVLTKGNLWITTGLHLAVATGLGWLVRYLVVRVIERKPAYYEFGVGVGSLERIRVLPEREVHLLNQ